ncbi:hypothetical protein HMPREF1990_01478, partial [Porphyromonas gingivalis W4087]
MRPFGNKVLYPFILSFYSVSVDCFVCLWYDLNDTKRWHDKE